MLRDCNQRSSHQLLPPSLVVCLRDPRYEFC